MTLSLQQYLDSDATELALIVQRGEASASELLDQAIDRYHQLNPQLNAVCQPMFEIARQRVTQPLAGPLAGVPILIKDAVQDYAGLPTSSGSKVFNRVPATQHAHLVRRLLDAGAVIMGKTNTPELALKGVTDPEAFGITRRWQAPMMVAGRSVFPPPVVGCLACDPAVVVYRPVLLWQRYGKARPAIWCCAVQCATPRYRWM